MIELLKTSIYNLIGKPIQTTSGESLGFVDVVSPLKFSLYQEIKQVSEAMHDIMLKTAKFVKVNGNLLPITGISYSDIQLLAGTPNNPLLSMSGCLKLGMDKYGQIKVIDFKPGKLLEFIEVASVNNEYCRKRTIQSACGSPESLLQNWLIYVINGYRKFLPVRNCALITNNKKEHRLLLSICKSIGLHIVCTDINDVKLIGNDIYHGKEKVDIIIRTPSFYDIVKNPSVLHDLLDAMYHKSLIMVNPVEEFIANSRSLQAIVWYLHETDQFFTEEEHKFINEYMLPTYIVPRLNGPTWLMQYFGDEEAKYEGFDEIPNEVLEEDGILYQYRGSDDFIYHLESYLIGNRFAGCVYLSDEQNFEYTFVKKA